MSNDITLMKGNSAATHTCTATVAVLVVATPLLPVTVHATDSV